MSKFIVGPIDSAIGIEASLRDINSIIRTKYVEEIVTIDEHTIEILLNTNKTLRIIKKGNEWVLNLVTTSEDLL